MPKKIKSKSKAPKSKVSKKASKAIKSKVSNKSTKLSNIKKKKLRSEQARTKISKAKFLKVFVKHYGIIGPTCEAIGVNRATYYLWMEKDKKFAAEVQRRLDQATDRLVNEANRRGCEGYNEPVFYQGKEVGKVKKFSDNLLMFVTKARRPDEYRDRSSVEVSGPGKTPITMTDLSQAKLAKILKGPDAKQALNTLAKMSLLEDESSSD